VVRLLQQLIEGTGMASKYASVLLEIANGNQFGEQEQHGNPNIEILCIVSDEEDF